jgi:hypothetical protein
MSQALAGVDDSIMQERPRRGKRTVSKRLLTRSLKETCTRELRFGVVDRGNTVGVGRDGRTLELVLSPRGECLC